MEDGEVMAWLLATIPEYAKEESCQALFRALSHNVPEAVIMALLDAYPDAAKEKTKVRCGRGRRVLCPLLSHSSHMRSMPSPTPLLSLAAVQNGRLPKDYAKTDAIKALLAV